MSNTTSKITKATITSSSSTPISTNINNISPKIPSQSQNKIKTNDTIVDEVINDNIKNNHNASNTTSTNTKSTSTSSSSTQISTKINNIPPQIPSQSQKKIRTNEINTIVHKIDNDNNNRNNQMKPPTSSNQTSTNNNKNPKKQKSQKKTTKSPSKSNKTKLTTTSNKRGRERPSKYIPNEDQLNENESSTNIKKRREKQKKNVTTRVNKNNNKRKKNGRGRPRKYVTVEDLVCKHCGAKFETRKALDNCLRNHCNIICEWPGCGKIFNRKTSFKDHMKRHNNLRTEYCRGCNYGPLYRSTRTSHERKCKVWINLSEAEKDLRRGKPGRPRKSKKNSTKKRSRNQNRKKQKN